MAFGDDAALPISLDMEDNVVIAAGTAANDQIELIVGAQTHLLVMSDYQFEFNAEFIDTFHIGGSGGQNTIRHCIG